MTKRMAWPALAAIALTLGLAAAPTATAAPVATTGVSEQTLSPEIQQIVDNLPAMRERAAAVKAQLGLDLFATQYPTLIAPDTTS